MQLEQVVASNGGSRAGLRCATRAAAGFGDGCRDDQRFRDRVKADLDLTVYRSGASDLGHGIASDIEHWRPVQEHDGDCGKSEHDDRKEADGNPDLPGLGGVFGRLSRLRFCEGGFHGDALALGGGTFGFSTKTFGFESRFFLFFTFLSSTLGGFASGLTQEGGHFG